MKRAGMLSKGWEVTTATTAMTSLSGTSSTLSSPSQTRIELDRTQRLWLANELQKGAKLMESGDLKVHTSALQHRTGGGWSMQNSEAQC